MKRLIATLLLCLFAIACSPEEQAKKDQVVGPSFRCMWIGDCAVN